MIPERWRDIVGNIKDKFNILEEGTDFYEDEGGVDVEYIVFSGPMGKIRLEFITRPIVLDKKTNYSNRIGSETAIKYVYSETEKSHQLIAYKWDDGEDDWLEMDGGAFNN